MTAKIKTKIETKRIRISIAVGDSNGDSSIIWFDGLFLVNAQSVGQKLDDIMFAIMDTLGNENICTGLDAAATPPFKKHSEQQISKEIDANRRS